MPLIVCAVAKRSGRRGQREFRAHRFCRLCALSQDVVTASRVAVVVMSSCSMGPTHRDSGLRDNTHGRGPAAVQAPQAQSG
jgi:hypothetical protein